MDTHTYTHVQAYYDQTLVSPGSAEKKGKKKQAYYDQTLVSPGSAEAQKQSWEFELRAIFQVAALT